MNSVLALLTLLLMIAVMVFVPPLAAPFEHLYGSVNVFYCAKALGFCAVAAALAGVAIRRNREHGSYLVKLFMFALIVRVALASTLFAMKGQDFFGGDAWTYDFNGMWQLAAWGGDPYAQVSVDTFVGTSFRSGWGMVSMVAAIYSIVGRNMLAVQFFNSVLGAATAAIVYLCAYDVFKNRRVAVVAGIAVAFYPSLVLWSAQGLKDGPIVFFLALSILATLRLGHRISMRYIAILVAGLFGVLAFRFYVFYMMLVAVGGAFIVGMRAVSLQSMARQFVVIIVLGLALTYLGVTRYASVQYEEFTDLQRLQVSRQDLSTARSGFGKDVDVSTTGGALSAIPEGAVYLLFAPFPWQLGSLRQSLTIPEMVIWWTSFPLLVLGIWFSLKHRLRQMSPIFIFTTMLTLAYSVVQGNVGTAYRQRAQLLVFYFIFVAVGAVLLKEKREEKRQKAAEALRAASAHLKPALVSRRRAQRI
ncbi:MAG: glycosyltransferase family 39 protein [Pyrinomonadaceae bacterium]